MECRLAPRFHNQPWAAEAKAIIGACVHCGFCTATCPTYVELRDERDGPRGRIYLIRELLNGGLFTEKSRRHLDRCLTCRNCETTCPSGVRYGRLVAIGRTVMEGELPPRPLRERLVRRALRSITAHPAVLKGLVVAGRLVRPLLPAALAAMTGERREPGHWPPPRHARKVIALSGCMQEAATPATNRAAARVLDRLGLSLVNAPAAGCCGALAYHMGEEGPGLDQVRRNIDAWWPLIEDGAEAIVPTASGCGSFILDYAEVLAHDPAYAAKARRVSELTRDLGEILAQEDLSRLGVNGGGRRVAVHVPCSQQHGLRLPELVEGILAQLGFALVAVADKHLCCGAGGANLLLEPDVGRRLRRRKLAALSGGRPDIIVTANVGCQLHLSGDETVVAHWIALLDQIGGSGTEQKI
jgi:glycolate oxidase iron-sulfur subunit